MRSRPRKKRRARTTKISTRPKSSAKPRRRSRKKKSTDAGAARAAYLGFGSNLGNRRRNLRRALAAIRRAARIDRVSSVYRAEPVGYAAQPDFENLVARILWRGTPRALLALARRTERDLGREETFRNGPRVIDVDLLDVGGIVRRSPDPVLPHPRLASRRFVLAPLAEIAPAWRHPVTGRSVKEMLAKLPKRPGVRRLRSRPRR